MTVETFVILSLDKFNHLDEKAKSQPSQVKDEPSQPSQVKVEPPSEVPSQSKEVPETPIEEDCSEPVDDESEFEDDPEEPTEEKKISKDTKALVKKKTVFQRHFEKMLSELEKFSGTELAISNMKQLIKAALGQSSRVLPNEQKFYSLLLQHDIFHLVKNKSKIKKYYPSWFRIS